MSGASWIPLRVGSETLGFGRVDLVPVGATHVDQFLAHRANELCPGTDTELPEDVGELRSHGGDTDEQPSGDLVVLLALGAVTPWRRRPTERIAADLWTSWEFADLVTEELRGLAT